MLAILWLIVWITVGEAFYDDYEWYTSDDGVYDERAFDSQRGVRGNFSDILRSFASSYISAREGDDELTLPKVKSRLRMLKVFTHTGSSKDFEPSKGQVLPLLEGSRYCTMGRNTKVDCNHCKCVAGQLYMCTGMICPKPPTKPQSLIICKEGKIRKIDSCNYCYCRNGHEICSTRDCRLQHDHLLIRSQYTCHEGARRKVKCNRCLCRNGEEYCTKNNCTKKKPTQMKFKQYDPPMALRMTYSQDEDYDDPPKKCKIGERHRIDSCNYCYCNSDRERVCSDNKCTYPQHIDAKYPLDFKEKECKIGSRFRKGKCNYCYCNYDHQTVCSKNKCSRKGNTGIPDENEVLRFTLAPKICLPHERFRMDGCNWCYCNRLRQRVCERKVCDPNQPVDTRYPHTTKQSMKSRNSLNFECEVGQIQRIDDCNFCHCTFSRKWTCSDNVCPSNYEHPGLSDEQEVLRFTPAPKICFPHERFRMDGCNWCYCNRLRQRVCERKVCDPNQPVDTRYPPNSPRKGCYIGSRFARGKCGYCYCSIYRRIECRIRYNCTDITTTTTTPKPINNTTKQSTKPRNSLNFECEVGQIQRIDDCNSCRCTFRREWMCSNNVCSSNYDHHKFLLSNTKLCTEGIRRQVDACNYCVCHRGVEFCTQKPCSRDTVPTIFSEPECLVGDPVPAPDPCNLCICLDSNILCSDNPCIQRQLDNTKSRCVEGHKYRMDDGCNFCLCQDGQEFCTSRACLMRTMRDKAVSDSTDCNEGEVTPAEDSCNMCVCMRGKIICTNKTCSRRKPRDSISESLLSYIRTQKIKKHKTTKGTKQRCSPGKKYFPKDFDPNCPNECICDRHELLCTKRKCYNNWDKQTPFKWPLGRKEKKNRNGNLMLKQESCDDYQKLPSDEPCNSCMCLNGRKVCTIIACRDDNEGVFGSDEALFNNHRQGSKVNKANMEKKNNNFCEPFTFFSPDGNRFCRNCFCLHNGLALCLLNMCKYSKDIPHQNAPQELNEVCTPGETGYPTKCVTCSCSEQGKWICTREELALCQERDCDEKDEFHMGFSPYCASCKCSVKEWFCSIQSEACSDYTERHSLDIVPPPKRGPNRHAWRAGRRSQYGVKMHRERCCPFSCKSLIRLLRHPREEMGWCYSLRPAPHGTTTT